MKKRRKNYFLEFIKGWGLKRIIISGAVIIFIISVIMIFYGMLYSTSKNSIIDKGKITAVQSAEQFDRYLSTGISAVELASYNLDEMIKKNSDHKALLNYLVSETNAIKQAILEMATGLYAYIDKDFLDGILWTPPDDFVPEERPWYTNAMAKNGKLAVTDPYIDANTGSVIITLSKSLSDGRGIVAIDILMDEIQAMTEKLSEENDGAIECVLDSRGNVISHSDREQLGKCYTQENDTFYSEIASHIYSDGKASNNGYFEVECDGSSYIVYTVAIQDKWVSVSIIDSSDEFVSLTVMLIVTIGLLILAIMIMLFVFSRSARKDSITAKLNAQLSSSANIYMSVYDIDMINFTYTDIKSDIDRVNTVIDSMEYGEGYVQQQINYVMTHFSSESSRDAMLAFIDLSTLDERMKQADTLTIEYLSDDKNWRRGRWIASERTPDGRLAHVLWVVEDIDAEKKERDKVYEKARQLTSQLRSAVNIYTTAHDIDVINDTFTVIHSMDKMISEAVGDNNENAQNTIFSIMNQMTDDSFKDEIMKFVDLSTLDKRLTGKESIAIEYRNSRQRWRRGRFIVSERTEDGKISHVLWTVEDIDEEKKMRDRLFDIADKLNTQLSSMGDIYISVYDIDIIEDTYNEMKSKSKDIKDLSLEYEDSAQLSIFKDVDRMTDPTSNSMVHQFVNLGNLDKRMKHNNTLTIEFLNSNKEWCRGRFISSQWTPSGKLSHVLWTVENINSEKTERDKLLDMSEKAIAASEAKSAFLSNMSHEIRTPINAVLGMNEMILRECDDRNILEYSESIRTAGTTLLGLINDILDFSKIEAGKMEIIPVDYDLSSVINDLVNMIQTKADDKGLQLVLDINNTIPKMLHGDEVRIKQVITNILTNAVKYTEEGTVTFCIRYEKIEDDPDSIMLNVSVRDTGIGIKKEDMRKLFSEFDRIEEERNRKVEGTGLGMSITQRLLEMMDSCLEVESIYELGSKFSFSLKQKVIKWEELGDYEKAYKDSVGRRKKYREKFTAPKARVLVVDDTPMNLMVFKSLLKQTKVQIDLANSGDEGLSMALENKYHIIFLDHMMPKKDGIQTLREMKEEQNNPNLETPTVCLTANAISGAREKYIEAGFDDYLTKPIDSAKLENLLLEYLPDELIQEPDGDTDIIEAEGEEKDEKLPGFLYDIDEINTETGVTNCGTVEDYILTLKTYAEAVDDYADEIEKYWKDGDIPNTTIKVHAVKSSSRIIGAADLGEFAQELENAGNAGDTEKLSNGIDRLLSRYKALGELLKPLLDPEEEDDSGKAPITLDELREAYGMIKESLSAFQFPSVDEIAESFKEYSIPDEEKERVKKIIAACEDYDYDKLPEILEQ